MLTGRDLSNREESFLAPYAAFSGKSKGRKYKTEESKHRTCYQRDKDRIIHSMAYRRLEYKTQVFVNHEADYYRTRLTHSIEVATISRSLAKALRLNEDLAESIASAHDIGHTPFGHAGEKALHEIMEAFGGFEHNSQSLRVVDYLEERYSDYPGLNLTYEVREGIIKHHTSYDNPDNKLLKDFEPGKKSSLEGQIVNIADEIAYNSHDLDDGLESGLISVEELLSVPLFKEYYDNAYSKDKSERMIVFEVIRELIGEQITDTVRSTLRRLEENRIETIDDVRNAKELVDYSDEMRKANNALKKYLFKNLYRNYKVLKMQHKAERYIRELFDVYNSDTAQLPPKFQAKLEKDGKERVICDYIAGMTDRYAQDEYTRLFLPYERM